MTARILIVDDVPANTRLLEAKLSAEYYQVASVKNGFDALTTAQDWQPDLILLDVMMPGMDGFECCQRLKDNPATLHIPVVMVTALGEPGERLRGLDAGADDFLTKPVEYETLMARVKSLVRLKRLLDEWRARGETARALGLAAERPTIPSVAGARALVVDDWDISAQTIQDALAREGVIPGRARSQAEAMTLSAAIPFDLIVLSLSLAEEDPLKLASSLRAADATHEIPMLLVAEPEERDRLLRGFDLGANDWLLLPVDENELRARARNQIRRKFYQDRLRADIGTALELAMTDPLTGLYNHRYLHAAPAQPDGGQAGARTGGADDRRRPLQDGERRLRPRGRGPGFARHRSDAARQHQGIRFAGALRRRGVRRGDAGRRWRRRRDGRRAAACRRRGAGFRARAGSALPSDDQHRHCLDGGRHDDAGSAAARRRSGAV